MNTGYLRPAVATVPTVYGIETKQSNSHRYRQLYMLQQYLPFTVLKPYIFKVNLLLFNGSCNSTYRLRY